MNKISRNRNEAINTPSELLPKRILRGLGQVANGVLTGVPAPLSLDQPREAISFFDAPAPELPQADLLDRLDAAADEAIIAASMSHIEIHKTED